MCSVRGFTSIVRVRSAMAASSTICHEGGNLAQKTPVTKRASSPAMLIDSMEASAVRLPQRRGVEGDRHRPLRWKDFFRKQSQALPRLRTRHPAVEKVNDHHLEADRVLERPDLLDDLVGGADRLGGRAAARAAP